MATPVNPDIIARYLKQRIDAAQKRVDQFASKFAENPADALEWAQDVFTAAANLEALKRVQARLARGVTVEDILKGSHKEILNKARNPHHSTSWTSNLIEQARLSAMVHVVEMLED